MSARGCGADGPSRRTGGTRGRIGRRAQELVWQLFQFYREAAATLGQDPAYAATVADLQSRLYLPQVSKDTGLLEEWMTPQDLDTSDRTHRHLSPLVGLFPGDRITADRSPAALLAGATKLLTARGMTSYGWGVAWRSLCWSRLKNAANAYQCGVSEGETAAVFAEEVPALVNAIPAQTIQIFRALSPTTADADASGPTAFTQQMILQQVGSSVRAQSQTRLPDRRGRRSID
ncbi:glycosyl hydrolase family 95 catalytic domain-containing protein [Kitasatospora sp. NPDC091335]|uniref:glycosyl hydrolase family 95 catalytic domain-containing protein n=1 Tax=Kitasatospora sp. NPDC091335 TaxID=3364085 RepID=UPI0037F93217